MTNNNTHRAELVAVYGSLLRGLGNHRLLVTERARFVGSGHTVDRYTMRDWGRFPAVYEQPADTRVAVELYEVHRGALTVLDGLEGHPEWYRRRLVKVAADDGTERLAWLYIMRADDVRGDIVTSGDWRQWIGG